jgi:hypothetical protein
MFLLSISLFLSSYNTVAQTDYAEVEWVKTFLGQDSSSTAFGDFTIDGAGNSYHTFTDHSYDTSWKAYYNTVKYNTLGNEVWSLRFLPEENIVNLVDKIALDGNGNVYISGTAVWYSYYKTLKYDSSGNLLWVSTEPYGNIYSISLMRGLLVDDSGNVFIAGETGAIIKYNPSGGKTWEIPKDGRHNYSMVLDKANKFIYISRSGKIVKLNYNGIKEWEVDDTVGYYRGAIMLDSSQNIYVNGYGLAKYTSDGMLDWVTPSHRDYMALDNFGNPVVFGYYSDGLSEQYKTIKFNSEGIKLWEKDYIELPPGSPDLPQSICIDRFNNIYATASVYDTDGTENIVTIKYSSSGEEKWTIVYDDPQNQYQYPVVVKVDPAGNVYVAGVIRLDGWRFADIIIKYRQPNYPVSVIQENVDKYSFQLFQNYPNPFNPSTIIKYQVPEDAFVIIKVYDILGKEVRTLVNEKTAGYHSVNFNGSNLSSGIYFYSIAAGNFCQVKKMILAK